MLNTPLDSRLVRKTEPGPVLSSLFLLRGKMSVATRVPMSGEHRQLVRNRIVGLLRLGTKYGKLPVSDVKWHGALG